jgi:nucleotide-binding universal stress UspA family protein
MQPFEMQLERIQVLVSSKAGGHVCMLRAWADRRQTVVIETLGASRLAAIETAADSLRHAIASRGARQRAAALPAPKSAPAPVAADAAPAASAAEREVGAGRHRVLLALHELDPSSACLHWARVLADSLQADLDVCRVLPDLLATGALPSGKAWLDATRQLLNATRETRRWCAEVLPHAKLSERLIPGAGNVVEEAALRARERSADWIVMPEIGAGCGRSATALARASGCPVLVARAPTSRSTLLIASDLSDDLYLISSRAAALAEALHAPVLAFHDVGFQLPELSSRVNALNDTWSRVQAERLDASGHRRLPELEVLLAHGNDRVETLLQQARREDAEIIIVGASERAAADGSPELAAAVVDRAIRSVLVVPSPLGGSPPAGRRPSRAGAPLLQGCVRRAGSRSTGALLRRPRSRRPG